MSYDLFLLITTAVAYTLYSMSNVKFTIHIIRDIYPDYLKYLSYLFENSFLSMYMRISKNNGKKSAGKA